MSYDDYSVICILQGNVAQFDVPDVASRGYIEARKLASDLIILRRADCVEIYDANDNMVWSNQDV